MSDATVIDLEAYRASRRLGLPDFDAIYTPGEQKTRWLLIKFLESSVSSPEGESKRVLSDFLSNSAEDRIAAAHVCDDCPAEDDEINLLDRYMCVSEAVGGLCSLTDTEFAGLPGATEKDICEARLSRACLDAQLLILADLIMDEMADGYEYSTIVSSVFPRSASTLDFSALSMQSAEAAGNVASRLVAGVTYPALSTADEFLTYYALGMFYDDLAEAGVEPPRYGLEDTLFEDHDFLLMFNPAFDGIEDSELAVDMGMTITGPSGWFHQFRPE